MEAAFMSVDNSGLSADKQETKFARLNNTNGDADIDWDPNAGSTVLAIL